MKGHTEGLTTLNKTLLRGFLLCLRFFGGRAHFSAYLPLLAYAKNVSVIKPSLEPDYNGGEFTPCMTCQGMVEVSTHRGSDASLLVQHLDVELASVDSLRTVAPFHLAIIPSAY